VFLIEWKLVRSDRRNHGFNEFEVRIWWHFETTSAWNRLTEGNSVNLINFIRNFPRQVLLNLDVLIGHHFRSTSVKRSPPEKNTGTWVVGEGFFLYQRSQNDLLLQWRHSYYRTLGFEVIEGAVLISILAFVQWLQNGQGAKQRS